MTDQIINVSFTISGQVHVDPARAAEDPWWEQYSRGLDLNDPEQFRQALYNYISAYVRAESLLDDVPWSCGPSSIYAVELKIGQNNDSISAQK